MVLTLCKDGSKVIIVSFYKTIIETLTENKMTKEEAFKILDLTESQSKNEIYAKYKNLFDSNEKQSKYLQSKIKNAYDFLNR